MFQPNVPQPDPSGTDSSALAALSRTLQNLEDRLARRTTPSQPSAAPTRPAADDASARPAALAPASGLPTPRKPSLNDAVSQIALQRNMLDEATPAPAPRAPAAAPVLPPLRAVSPTRVDEASTHRRDSRLKSLADDIETLRSEGSGFSLMSEVAGELQRLREELRQEKTGQVDPRFDEMRSAFDDLRRMIEARESAHLIGPELTRIADGLAQLTEEAPTVRR